MLKKVILKLKSIEHFGDSIGEDIRPEIEILGKFFSKQYRLKAKSSKHLNDIIGEFDTDRKIFIADINLRIIEEDPIFNDVGGIKKEIKIDTTKISGQEFKYEIEIKEWRATMTRAKAVFTLTLEAEVLDGFLYVSLEQSQNGWIRAINEEDKIEIQLPAYLRVKLERQDTRRQYFTIMEGLWHGTSASVKIESDGTSHLEAINNQTGPVHLIYSKSQNTLKFKNKIYKLREYKEDKHPWKNILYNVAIPDNYHRGGRPYLNRAKLAPIWFKTTHPDNERYVHPGTFSLGCVTLTEIERWDEFCKILIKSRIGDGQNIGILEVVD